MTQKTIDTVLRIDSSVQRQDSVSRTLGDEIVRRLRDTYGQVTVRRVELADDMPHIDASWVDANLAAATQRSRLAVSDQAVALLDSADAVVVTSPVYNFSIPSALKAWIDHVCRAGLTTRYTASGPQGLLADRPVYLAMASGGVAFGSAADFASSYLRQVFGFMGLKDIRLVGTAGVASDAETATGHLDQWLPVGAAGRVA